MTEYALRKPMTQAIFHRLPVGKEIRGVEVGIFNGDNAMALLTRCPKLTLICVDLWLPYPSTYRCQADDLGVEPRPWGTICERAHERLRKFGKRAKILMMESGVAAEFVEDESLDFGFVDSSHEEPYITRDIEVWRTKIKPGGWLGGHDYSEKFPEVRAAVDRYFKAEVELDVHTTWFVRM